MSSRFSSDDRRQRRQDDPAQPLPAAQTLRDRPLRAARAECAASPAYCISMLNAVPRHVLATITDTSASVADDSSGAGPSPTCASQ